MSKQSTAELSKGVVESMFIDLERDGHIEEWIRPNPSNRSISQNNLRKIRKTLLKYGHRIQGAITVGSDLVVKAGHHRFIACQQMQSLPKDKRGKYKGAWIVIDDSVDFQEKTEIDNAQKGWTTLDMIHKYASDGKEEYIRLVDFMTRHGLKLKATQALLNNISTQASQPAFDIMKDGLFKAKDWDLAEQRVEYMKELGSYLDNAEEWNNVHLVTAVQKCFSMDGFDPAWLVKKVARQSGSFRIQRNRRETLDMLEKIYNHGRRYDDRLRFA